MADAARVLPLPLYVSARDVQRQLGCSLVVAVCFDFGLGFDGAVVLIRERVEARAAKAAA